MNFQGGIRPTKQALVITLIVYNTGQKICAGNQSVSKNLKLVRVVILSFCNMTLIWNVLHFD